MFLTFAIALALIAVLYKILNEKFYVLAGCRRVRTVDGTPLETKLPIIKGKTIFGNNLDILDATIEKTFIYLRENYRKAKGKTYLLYFLWAPILSVVTAEDAEEVFQSQALITKSRIYDMLAPFLGKGLLISTDEVWQFRRKVLTPAFHFNILLTFLEIFKEETHKFIEKIRLSVNQPVTLRDVIPAFTLNNICETALGVKLDEVPGSDIYRKSVKELEPWLLDRACNPILYFDWIFWLTNNYRQQRRILKIIHGFSSKIIEWKRKEFLEKRKGIATNETRNVDDYGKKQRYAMLDTLLDAESKGLIDHQGICDEVNTFMFEGYDTTSSCLMFTLLNLASYPEIQQKCYEEVQNLADISELTLFELNKLEYLECVIKETLRLYPAVPFIARGIVKETIVNGLIMPPNAQVHIHIYDISRDERHFPEPHKFKPERFLAENTTNRHPFAFVPFSAGPRNCIGQKFAMLEVKTLLVGILQNFQLQQITKLEDLTLENGLVLRTKEKIQVKFAPRK